MKIGVPILNCAWKALTAVITSALLSTQVFGVTKEGQALAAALEDYNGEGVRIIQITPGPIDDSSTPEYGFYVLGSLKDTTGVIWNGQRFEAIANEDDADITDTDDDLYIRPIAFVAQVSLTGQVNWLRFFVAHADEDLEDEDYTASGASVHDADGDWLINPLGTYFNEELPRRMGGVSVYEDFGIVVAVNCMSYSRLFGADADEETTQYSEDYSDSGTSVDFLGSTALYVDDGASSSAVRSDTYTTGVTNLGAIFDFDGNVTGKFSLEGSQVFDSGPTVSVPTWISDLYFDQDANVYFSGFSDFVAGAQTKFKFNTGDFQLEGNLSTTMLADSLSGFTVENEGDDYTVSFSGSTVDWRTQGFVGKVSAFGSQSTLHTFVNVLQEYVEYDSSGSAFQPFENTTNSNYTDFNDVQLFWGMPLRITTNDDGDAFVAVGTTFNGDSSYYARNSLNSTSEPFYVYQSGEVQMLTLFRLDDDLGTDDGDVTHTGGYYTSGSEAYDVGLAAQYLHPGTLVATSDRVYLPMTQYSLSHYFSNGSLDEYRLIGGVVCFGQDNKNIAQNDFLGELSENSSSVAASLYSWQYDTSLDAPFDLSLRRVVAYGKETDSDGGWETGSGSTRDVFFDDEDNLFWSGSFQKPAGVEVTVLAWNPLDLADPDTGEPEALTELDSMGEDNSNYFASFDDVKIDFYVGALDSELNWISMVGAVDDGDLELPEDNLFIQAAITDDQEVFLMGELLAGDDNTVKFVRPSVSNNNYEITNTSDSIDEAYHAYFSWDYDSSSETYSLSPVTGYSIFLDIPSYIEEDWLDPSDVGIDNALQPIAGTAIIREAETVAIGLPYRLYFDVEGNLTHRANKPGDASTSDLSTDDRRIRFTFDSLALVGDSSTAEQGTNYLEFTLEEDATITVDYLDEYLTTWTVNGSPSSDWDLYDSGTQFALPEPDPDEQTYYMTRDDPSTPSVMGSVSAPATNSNGIITGARYVVTSFTREMYDIAQGLELIGGNEEIILGDSGDYTSTGAFTFQIKFEELAFDDSYEPYLLTFDDDFALQLTMSSETDGDYLSIVLLDGTTEKLSMGSTLFDDDVFSGMLTVTLDTTAENSGSDAYNAALLVLNGDGDLVYSEYEYESDFYSYSLPTTDNGIVSDTSYNDESIDGLTAVISQIRIWDIALTEDDVETYGNSVPLGTEDDLVGAWYFGRNEGSTAEDLTDNDNDAILADFSESNSYVSIVSSTPSTETVTPSTYSASDIALTSYSNTGPVDLTVEMQKQYELVVSSTEFEGLPSVMPVVWTFDEEPTLPEDLKTTDPTTNEDGYTGIGTYWVNADEYVVVGCFQHSGGGDALKGWSNISGLGIDSTQDKSVSLSDALTADTPLINTLSSGLTVDVIEESEDGDDAIDLTFNTGVGTNDIANNNYYNGNFYYFDAEQITSEITVQWTMDNPVFYFTDEDDADDTDAAFAIGDKLYPFDTTSSDIRNQVSYTDADGNVTEGYILHVFYSALGIDESYYDGSDSSKSIEYRIVNTANGEPAYELISAIKSSSSANTILGWNNEAQALVAMQPGTVEIQWDIEVTTYDNNVANNSVTKKLSVEIDVLDPTDDTYSDFYEGKFITMALDAGNALLDPEDADAYLFYDQVYWSGSDLTKSSVLSTENGPELYTPYEGYTVLRFLTTSDGTVPRGDLVNDEWEILVIESEQLSADALDDSIDYLVDFTFGGEEVDVVDAYVGEKLSSLNSFGEDQDKADLSTGKLMETSQYGYLAPINPDIYSTTSDDAVEAGLPEGNIIPVNTIEYASNAEDSMADLLPYQLIVVWYDGGDDYYGAYVPANPLQYNIEYPDVSDCNGFITVSSALGSQSLYGDGTYQGDDDGEKYATLPSSDFINASIYYQNDSSAQGYNPNEEHALITDKNSNDDENFYTSEDGDAVFALRTDLNITADTQSNFTNSPELTSEAYVLVTYFDSDEEEYDMLVYKVYKETSPNDSTITDDDTDDFTDIGFDLVGYTAGDQISAPYPLTQVVGATSVPDFYQPDDDADFTPYWEDVNGDYWVVAGDSDFYGYFFYPMTGSFHFPELTDSDGTADYANGDIIPWFPTSLTLAIPDYDTGDDLESTYEAESDLNDGSADWAPVTWTLESEWPDNVAVLKIGESIIYSGGDFYDNNSFYPTLPTIDYDTEGTVDDDDDSYARFTLYKDESDYNNGETSVTLAYDATASEVESAIQTIYNGSDVADVSGEFPTWTVTFSSTDSQADLYVVPYDTDIANLTSDADFTVESATVTEGGSGESEVQVIYLSGLEDSAYWAITTTQGDDTNVSSSLPLNATATQVQVTLNDMNGGTGPFKTGTVTVTGESPAYTVTWNDAGSQGYLLEGDYAENDYPIEYVSVSQSIAGDSDTQEVQVITLTAQQVEGLPGVVEWDYSEIVFDELNPTGDSFTSLTEAQEKSTVRLVNMFETITVDIVDEDGTSATFSDSVTGDDEIFSIYSGEENDDYYYFYMFPSSLQTRLAFDPVTNQLAISGLLNGTNTSSLTFDSIEDSTNYTQPNIISGNDLSELFDSVLNEETWQSDTNSTEAMVATLESLYFASRNPNGVFASSVGSAPELQDSDDSDLDVYEYSWLVGLEDSDDDGDVELESLVGTGGVLTTNFSYLVQQYAAGEFDGSYVVIAENNNEDAGGAAVALEVIYVAPELVTGSVVTIEPSDAFTQKLTLRMSEDFGANDSYYDFDTSEVVDLVSFDWIYQLPDSSNDSYPQPPDDLDSDAEGWTLLSTETAQEINLENNTALLLTDYWFYARYDYTDSDSGTTVESLWAGSENSETTDGEYIPQLATGWVNRVLDSINYFENRYTDFESTLAPESWSSIIQQAGAPYSGSVSLSDDSDSIQDAGLIEFYTTIYDYAYDLADSAGVVSDVSDALLNAANRIAFLYYLLGNEAYADALDPMIGVVNHAVDPNFPSSGTDPQGHGLQNIALPPTAHAFDEMVIDLNQEELALLRGLALSEPDDPSTDQPSTGAYPVHNRLYWNMTGGLGQMAYTLNYAPVDFLYDGFLNEVDAEFQYPQGHGDAWGHYLSSLSVYYDLLSIDNFSWNYDSQAYTIDDSVVEVYYWNERRFAQTAAARAQAGIDILRRTFLDYYTENSEGQWIGYEDTNEYRGWGVVGWGRRVGQGAFFDWVTANALVPAAPAPEAGSFNLIYDGLVTDDIEVGAETTSNDETTYTMYDLDTIAENIEDALNDADVLGADAVSVESISNASGALLTFQITWAEAADTTVLEVDTSGLAQSSFGEVEEYTEGSADDNTASVQILTIQQDDRVFGTVSRSTVEDIAMIASRGVYVQDYTDRINEGLNPVGISPHATPFDIDPFSVLGNSTNDDLSGQFEQIYDRALDALRLAFRMYGLANVQKASLRSVERSTEQLRLEITTKDFQYRNLLKQFFGSPYTGTMGNGLLYDSDYTGPDYYLYNYLDNNVVNDYVTPLPSEAIVDFMDAFPINLKKTSGISSGASGDAGETLNTVFGHYFTSDGNTDRDLDIPYDGTDDLSDETQTASLEDALVMSFDGNLINLPLTASDYAYLAPDSWGQREFYGKIQIALTQMVREEGALRVSIKNYDNLIDAIQTKIALIQARYDIYDEVLTVLQDDGRKATGLRAASETLEGVGNGLRFYGDAVKGLTDIAKDGAPRRIGFTEDTNSVGRTITWILNNFGYVASRFSASASLSASGITGAAATDKEYHVEKAIFKDEYPYELQVQLEELEDLLNEEPKIRYEIFNNIEALRSAQQEYLAAEAEGNGHWGDRIGWNRKLAEATQKFKTQDMAFRIERNAVLQQYREAFEVAQRYIYLAAKAYDYETSLDPSDPAYIGPILDEILSTSFLGMISGPDSGNIDFTNGEPIFGQGGLAHALAWMDINFSQLEDQNGHTQPANEVLDFSLREELAGLEKTADNSTDQATYDSEWLTWLISGDNSTFYSDLQDNEYYNLYCRPWNSDGDATPGFVIDFSSTVSPGLDFFGGDLDGGDSAYDPTRFATRIYSVGIELENYDTINLAETPRCYLVPVGTDISRVPDSLSTEYRSWNVVEQKLPVPIPATNADLENAVYSPIIDGLDGYFGDIRLHSTFPASTEPYDADFDLDTLVTDNRLVGRSVWNTKWVLIIPLESMLYLSDADKENATSSDAYGYFLPNDGNGNVVNGSAEAQSGITDIILHLQTYSFSGN
ncbi:hypothetical protein [Rubellicoccus peritrichatus]|uniref:Uncharacterized protein n=1 Tax=Rubellicoccus peritrichatus TaxID=3080537 RepID=A0AAQ3LJV5_9BACT|nr:hypothetical protein [Puniceicoccus sp. CR14]WOO43594.1 hypothetical protein RZN69_10890 [Puniceicoccus sp. CR14]